MSLHKHLNTFKKILAVATILFIVAAVFLLYSDSFFKPPLVKLSPQEEVKRIFEACKSVSGDYTAHEKCTAHEFADAGKRWGTGFIVELLTAYQNVNLGKNGYQDCHILAHRIMNDLGSREPGKWKELIRQMNEGQLDPNRCGGGFMHGVLEVQSGQDPDFKVNADLFRELCYETLRQSSNCAHILGHLALVEAYKEVDEALKACKGLSGDFLFQCYGGIFMEDTMRTNLNAHGLADLPERNMNWFETQFRMCNKYNDKAEMAEGCWYVLSEVFMQTHQFDLKRTYEFCESAPSKDAKDQCYRRASYLFALLPDYLLTVFPARELCAAYESGSSKLTRCAQDVVGSLLDYSMGFIDRSVLFCAQRTGASKVQCFELIAKRVAESGGTDEGRKTLCNKLPEQNRASCAVDH